MCRACQEAANNVAAFEECQLYYGHQEDVCVNQASLCKAAAGMVFSCSRENATQVSVEAAASLRLEALPHLDYSAWDG